MVTRRMKRPRSIDIGDPLPTRLVWSCRRVGRGSRNPRYYRQRSAQPHVFLGDARLGPLDIAIALRARLSCARRTQDALLVPSRRETGLKGAHNRAPHSAVMAAFVLISYVVLSNRCSSGFPPRIGHVAFRTPLRRFPMPPASHWRNHDNSPAPQRSRWFPRWLLAAVLMCALLAGIVGSGVGVPLGIQSASAQTILVPSTPTTTTGSPSSPTDQSAAPVPTPTAQATVSAAPTTASSLQATLNLQAATIAVAQNAGAAVVSIRSDQGLGSGVIYDPSGLILTNAHVVEGATEIVVGLVDGRHFPGQALGIDDGFDLAVVRITGQNLPSAPLGDSSTLQVGQFVVAIGNPYGFDHTVTTGVISALNRPIAEGQGSYDQPMIQTDAAVNPGNSGGPLLDLQGNVVGITTLIATSDFGIPAPGLGFAVPVNTAKRVAPQLIQSGQLVHSGLPYLGGSYSSVGVADPSGTAFGIASGTTGGIRS